MIYVLLIGGLFLSWSFGRNSLSSIFGSAIGTRMVPLSSAAILAGGFILLGALCSGAGTTDTMLAIADIPSLSDALFISISIILTVSVFSQLGLPITIAQSTVGALVGWNIFHHITNDWPLIASIVGAWFYSPLLGAFFAILGFYLFRLFLKYVTIPLLYQDIWVRLLMTLVGCYFAYFLGANNIPAIISPYLKIAGLSPFVVVLLAGLAAMLGSLMANKKVIETISSGLYPLSSLEALVVVLSCGLTLYCFSGNGLEKILWQLHLPAFPLVPIPTANVLVGSTLGLGLVKGHAGIHWHTLIKIVFSWIAVPLISGLICYGILAILLYGRISL